MYKIKSLNLEIIDTCNLKCSICDIWKNKKQNILNNSNIKDILFSNYINKNTDITITGGEPLLNKNIKGIFQLINDLDFKIKTLSTNGILYNKLEQLLFFCIQKNIKLPNIHISIDGLEINHDNQRGIEGSFKKTIENIIKLKKKFNSINIKIKYTITKKNINDIKYIYLLSKKIGTDISFKIVENDIFYTNKIKKPELINNNDKKEIINILKSIYKGKNKYINNLIYYLNYNKLNFKCKTPKENLFIMASGDVFCCTKYNNIGNIKKEKIDTILFQDKHSKIINTVDKNNCSKCFSLHGSYKSII